MNLRHLRIAVSILFFGFLFFFFVPFLYDSTLFQCANSQVLCLANSSGLKSLGFAIYHWGGVYSFEGEGDLFGYSFVANSLLMLSSESILSTFGTLLFIAFPIGIGGVALLTPEIVNSSKVGTAGLVVFGIFAFIPAMINYVLLVAQHASIALTLMEAATAVATVWMISYGVSSLIMHIDPMTRASIE